MTNELQPESLTMAVLEAVSNRQGTDTTSLPPLHESIDAEALDQIFAPTFDGTPRTDGFVRFSYAGFRVTAHGDGSVELDRERPDGIDHA